MKMNLGLGVHPAVRQRARFPLPYVRRGQQSAVQPHREQKAESWTW